MVVRRYIDFHIYISYPYSSCIGSFCSSIPTFCSFFKCFTGFLENKLNVFFVKLNNNNYFNYKLPPGHMLPCRA